MTSFLLVSFCSLAPSPSNMLFNLHVFPACCLSPPLDSMFPESGDLRQLVYPKQVTRASLVAQRLKCLPAMRETWVRSLGWEDSPGEGNGSPLQYSCLENSMYGGARWAIVNRVAKSQTRLSDFTFKQVAQCLACNNDSVNIL